MYEKCTSCNASYVDEGEEICVECAVYFSDENESINKFFDEKISQGMNGDMLNILGASISEKEY